MGTAHCLTYQNFWALLVWKMSHWTDSPFLRQLVIPKTNSHCSKVLFLWKCTLPAVTQTKTKNYAIVHFCKTQGFICQKYFGEVWVGLGTKITWLWLENHMIGESATMPKTLVETSWRVAKKQQICCLLVLNSCLQFGRCLSQVTPHPPFLLLPDDTVSLYNTSL